MPLSLFVFLHLQLFEQLLEMLHGHILQHNGSSTCLLDFAAVSEGAKESFRARRPRSTVTFKDLLHPLPLNSAL